MSPTDFTRRTIDAVKDVQQRHRERHTPSGYQFVLADSIELLNINHWEQVSQSATVFLSPRYLRALEAHCPENTLLRYAMVYQGTEPQAVILTQIADISFEQVIEDGSQAELVHKALQSLQCRMMVCGNLISSGLHGIAFAPGVEQSVLWPAIAEALYRIRRAEKLSGDTDLIMIKDIKGEMLHSSDTLRRFSYRPIQCDPDMVLELEESVSSFEDYLSSLTSSYRKNAKRIIKKVEEAGFRVEFLDNVAEHEARIHELYMEVERRASVRLAGVAPGYFTAMAKALGPDAFRCSVLRNDERIVAFVTTLRDQGYGFAYYVGFDYELNTRVPLYLRLLQMVIADALAMGCRTISFGRTASTPKANLGAKPLDTHVWMRHRIPAVNFFVRKLFASIPYEEAPERNPMK